MAWSMLQPQVIDYTGDVYVMCHMNQKPGSCDQTVPPLAAVYVTVWDARLVLDDNTFNPIFILHHAMQLISMAHWFSCISVAAKFHNQISKYLRMAIASSSQHSCVATLHSAWNNNPFIPLEI